MLQPSHLQKQLRKRSFSWPGLLFILLIFSSCARVKMEKVNYDPEKDMYEYAFNDQRKVSLRTDSGYVVTERNYHDLKRELQARKCRYPFNKRIEDAFYLKSTDFRLASHYFNVNRKILSGEYGSAIDHADHVLSIYPDAAKYSDCLFLKAYAYEKLGRTDLARYQYKRFLRLSSGKYSQRFRSHRDADPGDSLFTLERIYARQFVVSENPSLSRDVFQDLTPTYHYNSFHPGYNLNEEDLRPGSKTFVWITAGYNIVDHFIYGLQLYHKLDPRIDLNAGIYSDNNNWGSHFAVPIQVYRSENNDLGFKISPFFTYDYSEKLDLEGISIDSEQSFVDFGAKLSLGYYLSQKFSLGAYYTYHFHNKQNPYVLDNYAVHVWYVNTYDLSLYYHITKGLSLKGGIRNGRPAVGMVLSGWEFGYDFVEDELISRVELY